MKWQAAFALASSLSGAPRHAGNQHIPAIPTPPAGLNIAPQPRGNVTRLMRS
jgi:hypothetical protein